MKHRRNMLLALCVTAVLAARSWAGSGFVAVSNQSMRLLPAPAMRGAPAWTSGAIRVQGEYVTSDDRTWMCLVAPSTLVSSTNKPAGADDLVCTNGYTWRCALTRDRKGMAIQNLGVSGAPVVFITDSGPAATNKGVALYPLGGAITLTGSECPQYEMYAICPGGTNYVSTMDW